MRTAAGAILIVALSGSPVGAQVSDVEVPAIVIDVDDPSIGPTQDEALDLANIVQSAAKGVTTVQEAPVIVTVVTADEIRDRQFQDLGQLADAVPGWSRIGLGHSLFPQVLVRGQVQAVQFLHDGLSLFDPFANTPTISRVQPMELIKRVEMITGPGGVLWGSNSLLGILNVITKDAEDLEGVEMGATLGHGKGDRLMSRAYVMAGASDVADGRLKLFGHGSVETYQGPGFEMPLLLFHQPLPQPNASNTYGPLTSSNQKQSLVVNLSGKLTLGRLQLRASVPFGRQFRPMGLSGEPVNGDDPVSVARENRVDQYDRYVVGEYRDRFAEEKAGIAIRAYAQELVRGFQPLQVLAPSALLEGGLAFASDWTSYRVGTAVDGEVEIGKRLRVLYGAEGFHEWKPVTTTTSRQGAGTQADLLSPFDLTRLPILCPRRYDATSMSLVPVPGCPLTFAFDGDRTVLGAYVAPQLRPTKRVILDAGARVQVAPDALGTLSYPVNVTVASTVVYNFVKSWHLKLNYAQGFRPPVFNNTLSNGEAVQIGGNPDLSVEKSDATQLEINARIFKGERRIRELSFRVDGSYTRLSNLIQVAGGTYTNSGDRGVASGEFLGKLFIQGGHRVELGYTWMRVTTADRGELKSVPEHWFNLATVFAFVPSRLVGTTNLKVVGAAEDPNRLVEYRGSSYMAGIPQNPVTVHPTDLVLDRLPPVAELSLGLTWTPIARLAVRATVYNALLAHNYQPDPFFDYEPHLEYLPNPYEGLRAYLSALYQY
jgi:outer membrane receptor protein involved in Fe transport